MPLPTTATLVYTMLPVSPVTQEQLAAAVTALPLPTGDPANIGATLLSDTTAMMSGSRVVRTVVFTLTESFFLNFNFNHATPPAPAFFNGFFKNLFTHVLGGQLGTAVVAAVPVLA